MLIKLHIQNYAIIDDLEINFNPNLNIITGETGAGKSIVMGALGLILGQRADSSVLQDKEKKCVVEGFFKNDNNEAVKKFLLQNDLDAEEDLMVRREIAANGKSRAFINDTPVNVNQLKNIGAALVDLHQQFDTLALGDTDFQREVLDALSDNTTLLLQYTTLFNQYTQTKKEGQDLQAQQAANIAHFDYNNFLYNELHEAHFTENELENLEAELKLLSNAENIKQQLNSIYFALKESEQPIVQQLKLLSHQLNSVQHFNASLQPLNNRLQSTQIELQDIADELQKINEGLHYNAQRIETLNERIFMGYKLFKKHQVNTTAQLLQIQEALQQKLNDFVSNQQAVAENEKATNELLLQCQQLANTLSLNRKNAIEPFTKNVNALLKQVGMPNAQIKIELSNVPINYFGADAINFLFDANKSNKFEPLQKVASGGELSRLMLCIKSLVAQKLQLPTLIFDEIDTGISGEAAKQVGNIMKQLSHNHQIIAITHQPQIAAKANAHYFIYKMNKENKIVTLVKLLTTNERITTIAQMLSGEKPTEAALQNAKEMIEN